MQHRTTRSLSSRQVLPDWGPYAVSKASVDELVKIYAGEITKTRVRVNMLDPGIVRTRLRARTLPGEDPFAEFGR